MPLVRRCIVCVCELCVCERIVYVCGCEGVWRCVEVYMMRCVEVCGVWRCTYMMRCVEVCGGM